MPFRIRASGVSGSEGVRTTAPAPTVTLRSSYSGDGLTDASGVAVSPNGDRDYATGRHQRQAATAGPYLISTVPAATVILVASAADTKKIQILSGEEIEPPVAPLAIPDPTTDLLKTDAGGGQNRKPRPGWAGEKVARG